MNAELRAIMKLDVPLIVRLGRRELRLSEVIRLVPGAIVELTKQADEELELLVNNKVIGTGKAVKVGENFGLRMAFVGDLRQRVAAVGAAEEVGGAAGAPGTASVEPAAPAVPVESKKAEGTAKGKNEPATAGQVGAAPAGKAA